MTLIGKSYYFTGDKETNLKLQNCKLFLQDFTDAYFDLHGEENPGYATENPHIVLFP
jgi:hypothetical protein